MWTRSYCVEQLSSTEPLLLRAVPLADGNWGDSRSDRRFRLQFLFLPTVNKAILHVAGFAYIPATSSRIIATT